MTGNVLWNVPEIGIYTKIISCRDDVSSQLACYLANRANTFVYMIKYIVLTVCINETSFMCGLINLIFFFISITAHHWFTYQDLSLD